MERTNVWTGEPDSRTKRQSRMYSTYNTLYIAAEHWYYNVTTCTVVTIFELIFFKAHAYTLRLRCACMCRVDGAEEEWGSSDQHMHTRTNQHACTNAYVHEWNSMTTEKETHHEMVILGNRTLKIGQGLFNSAINYCTINIRKADKNQMRLLNCHTVCSLHPNAFVWLFD